MKGKDLGTERCPSPPGLVFSIWFLKMLAAYILIHRGYRLSRDATAKLEEEIDKSVGGVKEFIKMPHHDLHNRPSW